MLVRCPTVLQADVSLPLNVRSEIEVERDVDLVSAIYVYPADELVDDHLLRFKICTVVQVSIRNQFIIEHYAMFYENFQDGTWNDADGIIDAGCAYICEWDDPTDKISQGDSFTDQQLRIIAKDLGVPDDLNVEIRQSPKAYWESAGLWDIYVEITHNGKLVASGSFDVETGEMGRNIYIYTPV